MRITYAPCIECGAFDECCEMGICQACDHGKCDWQYCSVQQDFWADEGDFLYEQRRDDALQSEAPLCGRPEAEDLCQEEERA